MLTENLILLEIIYHHIRKLLITKNEVNPHQLIFAPGTPT